MIIYNGDNTVIIDTPVEDSSTCTRAIMRAHTLSIDIKSPTKISIPTGAWTEFEGVRYTLFYRAKETTLSRHNYLYSMTMHTDIEDSKNILIKDPSTPPRTAFTLTGTPREHLELFVRSMGQGWTVDECIEATPKMIAYSNESCWSALGKMADAFGTEWSARGKRVALGKDERYKDNPVPLSHGKGNGLIPGSSYMGDADKIAVGKLFVIGGNRNIDPNTYKAPRLHLPKGAILGDYKVDPNGLYLYKGEGVGREAVITLEEIYPHRQGTVSEVITVNADKHFYDIKDAGIPAELNYNDYRIPGTKARLKFETGMLAGREFDIEQTDKSLTGYVHAERRFRVVPREVDGIIMPGGALVPAVGDKYAVFGITLPQAYITAAEQEMLREGIRNLAELSQDILTFDGELSPIYALEHWGEIGGRLVPGGHILYTDDKHYPDGKVIRITSIEQKVNNPHAPTMTLSTTSVSGNFTTVLATMEAQEVVNRERYEQTVQQLSKSWQQVNEAKGMIEEAYKDMGKSISAPTVTAMQMIVGDKYGQFRFYEVGGANIANPYPLTFDKDTAQLSVRACDLQHYVYGSDGARPSKDIIGGRTPLKRWSIAPWSSPALSSDKAYYIYAMTKGANCTIELSETPRNTGETLVNGKYNYTLPVGILTSVDRVTGQRAFAPLHGYTEVTPGQIVVDRIKSAGGTVDIDLINEQFVIGDPQGDKCLAWINGKFYIKGTLITVGGKETTIERALQDQSDKVDDIKVGTRNLLLKSGEVVSNSKYKIHTYELSEAARELKTGDPVVLAMKCRLGEGKERFIPYNSGGSVGIWSLEVKRKDIGADGVAMIGGTWRTDAAYGEQNRTLEFYALRDGVTVESTIEWVKLVRGNRASRDWEEAPEDIEERYQKLISNVDVEFALGDSMTVAPSSGWHTTAPAPQTGKYLWQRTKTTLKDGNVTYKGVTCIQGKHGTDGAKGRGVKSVTEQYYHSTSMTALTGGSWGSSAPTPAPGKWIWTRSVIAYDDNTSTTTSPICVTGDKGDKGAKGDDGAPGKDGNPGKDGKDAINYSAGLLLYGDPTFTEGVNWTTKYNNAGGNTTTWERIAKPADCPSSSTHAMSYKYLGGGSTQPGFGGFAWHTTSRANAVFVYRIIAKIPVGYNIAYTANKYGDGGTQHWLTEDIGTGKYEEYVVLVKCGSTGTFSSIGYFYFYKSSVNTPNAPFEVIVSYATAFDMTSAPNYYQQLGKEQRAREEAERKLRQDLGNANKTISTLQKLTEEIQSGKLDASRFADIQYLLDALQKNSAVQTGILLSNDIILSRATDGTVTAYLSGEQGEGRAMLRCGVKDAFTPNETARVTIWSNGTVEIGNMRHVVTDNGGDYIEFEDKAANHTYMQIGGNATSESDMILGSTKHTTYQLGTILTISKDHEIDRFVNSEGRRGLNYTLDVGIIRSERSAIGRPMTLNKTTVDIKLQVAIAGSNGAHKQTLNSDIKRQVVELLATTKTEYMFGKIVFSVPESAIAKGDTIMASVILRTSDDSRYDEGGWGLYVKDATVTIPKDTLKSLVTITKDKVAFFFGRQKYLLFNYFNDWLLKIVGNVLVQGTLQAEYIETSGAVLAGGQVDANGGVSFAFGRYKNHVGKSVPQVDKLGSGQSCYLRVHHSIGSTRYVPFVTPANTPYSDQPSIVNKQANYFDVRFYNTSGQSYHYPFNYICHRAD